MTHDQKLEYGRLWRLRNKTYQRDHRRWMSAEHAKIKETAISWTEWIEQRDLDARSQGDNSASE